MRYVSGLLVLCSLLIACTSCSPSITDERISEAMLCSLMRPETQCPQLKCENKSKNSIASYSLEASELTPGDNYILYVVRLDGVIIPWGKLTASDQHKLVGFESGEFPIKKGDLLSCFAFEMDGYMKGEPIYFCLIGTNNEHFSAYPLCPNPLEISWNDGAEIKAIALKADMNTFFIQANGFKPHETIRMVSRSWHETVTNNLSANKDGQFILVWSPAVKGKTGGVNYLTFERPSSSENRELIIPFGSFAKQEENWKY